MKKERLFRRFSALCVIGITAAVFVFSGCKKAEAFKENAFDDIENISYSGLKRLEPINIVFNRLDELGYEISDICDTCLKIKQSFIDKQEAIKELKIFLDKIWYKMNREMYWYNSHKDSDIYFGYWSFESAALVKLLGLDDSILRDNKYYPYDIAHFNN